MRGYSPRRGARRLRLLQRRRGLPIRSVLPNAVTVMAMCFGLTGIRFAFEENWQMAIGAIVIAGVLDGIDGRIARLMKGESRFGAELDSLSDCIAFGVAPALVIYLWSLNNMEKLGWVFALTIAVGCALRLARFNAQIDVDEEQPHKSAGFLTGIPAPAGAGVAFVPFYLWFVTDNPLFREVWIVAPWTALIAFLMISNVATFSWTSLRLRRNIRLEAIAITALLGTAMITTPWWTLIFISVVYLALIPAGMVSYAKVKRRLSD
ncbi:CDP-alcohol phosphatidyltransferase family protein [Parasphingorhabdus sp. DH2-15]|uniref:CDP-alcohol phosphatidyltransferase family protein n=1 Tax=Parasphingorhabdus sp. DH2-15 TaxID=3444112 RepID=UPI003F68477E